MNYDVIVIGAGHAGIEAAYASARLGSKTLLLTMNADQIGTMSCNPAVGGLGKSQLAREVDALGGLMGRIADKTAMQYRVLNESKGSAVRATRVQVDRHEYRAEMKDFLESVEGLWIKQGQVARVIFDRNRIAGVITTINQKFSARAVVVTTGTFMNGKAHIGKESFSSGRAGEPPSIGLSDFFSSLGMKVSRLKTGTVPRVDRRSIDFSKVEEQESHRHCSPLSLWVPKLRDDLESAHITYTNETTHAIIHEHLSESPLYSGIIESRGPRYCPSIEDKVVRFADKSRHQIFLEREGRRTQEVYVGGLSTSLPYDAQNKFLRSIPGLERVEIIRPGYAIEYDRIDANQLDHHLQMKEFPGLFFAGQVNGTSGYEEAAAQGVLAGINAALSAQEREGLRIERSDGYLGVMVDDLVTKPMSEPYRMFTSRAEWRLILRQDNADRRLSIGAFRLGLLSEGQWRQLEETWERRDQLRVSIGEKVFNPKPDFNVVLAGYGEAPLKSPAKASDLLRRPSIGIERILEWMQLPLSHYSEEDLRFVESEIKYEGYIRQAEQQVKQNQNLNALLIPRDFDFQVAGLSREAHEVLSHHRPETLGDAARLPAVTPASVQVLAIHLLRKSSDKRACRETIESDVISVS